MTPRALAAIAATAALLATAPARADDAFGGDSFDRAGTSLERGDFKSAVATFESLADRGKPHPDVSYNRGLAYAMRARGKDAEPGDLGQAAAGFQEALALRPDDAEAARALDLIRAEVARRRSRQDKDDTVVKPAIDRIFLRLAPPHAWAIAAVVSSVLFAVGLLLRARGRGAVEVAGTVVLSLAAAGLLTLTPAAFAARSLERDWRQAVVVVPEVPIEDDAGKPIDAPDLPEAALVELGQLRGDEALVRWGAHEGWVPRTSVRPLADRSRVP